MLAMTHAEFQLSTESKNLEFSTRDLVPVAGSNLVKYPDSISSASHLLNRLPFIRKETVQNIRVVSKKFSKKINIYIGLI